MVEHFDIFDELGNPLGTASRTKVHREGLWHRASNVFLFRPDGQLLIQRRQLSKDVWPGAWDVSAAEHLKPGETFEQGAIRGLHEELGVAEVRLESVGSVTKSRLEDIESGVRDYEFQQSFRAIYAGPISPDLSEVMETRMVSLAELEVEFQEQPEAYTPWFRQRAVELQLFRKAS
jgi:isopentenyl-diphosphate delta-isomerase type 1